VRLFIEKHRAKGRIEGGTVRGWEGGRGQKTEDGGQKVKGIEVGRWNAEFGSRKVES